MKHYNVTILRSPFEGKRCETLEEAQQFAQHFEHESKSGVELCWAVVHPDKFWIAATKRNFVKTAGTAIDESPWVIEFHDSSILVKPDKSEYDKFGADYGMDVLEAVEVTGEHGSVWVYLLEQNMEYNGGWCGFCPRSNTEFFIEGDLEFENSKEAREEIMRLAREVANTDVSL